MAGIADMQQKALDRTADATEHMAFPTVDFTKVHRDNCVGCVETRQKLAAEARAKEQAAAEAQREKDLEERHNRLKDEMAQIQAEKEAKAAKPAA